MTHLGDITKIDWFHVLPVDVVTGGSPCQDLSVAGKRAGLAGERSGLYMEQIRCVKELRQADEQRGRTGFSIRPRYMVWENVPGAFSSNGGEDFRAVLEEAAKIAQPDAVIPRPPKGKWTNSGAIVGDGWSIAWRVHDAQFWGVPQRRRRISVVCDFGGLSAPEILFERKGLSGDFEPGGTPGEEAAGGAGNGVEGASGCMTGWDCQSKRIFSPDGICATLNSGDREGGNITPSVFCAGFSYGQSAKASSVGYQEERSPTLRSGEGGNQKPCVYDARDNGDGKTVCTLTGDHQNRVTDYTALCIGNGQMNQSVDDKAGALNCMHDQQVVMVLNDQGGSVMDVSHDSTATLRAQSHGHEPAVMISAVDCRNLNEHQEVSGTLQSKENGGYSLNYQNPIMVQGAYKNAETRSKTLLLLQETYGEETILKWGTAILERLQQADILQQGVYESRISGEAEKWNELDDCALPRTELVTGWMLRDLWKQQKCGRSPQGWESAEQQSGQFAESLPKLSQQNSQACKDLFDMWQKGEGLWLLREALSEIQKIWKSLNGQRQSVYGHSIVRRLTPLEAERLQGYPDGWTDIGEWVDSKGKRHKDADSPRYKALGNSIALPFWFWLLRRISAQYIGPATLGSLFDGIGGFPLCWERCNGNGTALWASEIEEFPMAVTRRHFGEDEWHDIEIFEKWAQEEDGL